MTEYLLYVYAESPVHAGAADSLDALDLPVQREAATGYPVIWGQSLKGALRQSARAQATRDKAAHESGVAVEDGWTEELVTLVFGSAVGDTDGPDGETRPGLLNVGDAQLVAIPVPTLRKTFAWVTSGIALGRLARKYGALGRQPHHVPTVGPESAGAVDDIWRTLDREVFGPWVVPVDRDRDEQLARWAGELADEAIGTNSGFAPFADKLREDLILAGDGIMPTLLRECTEQTVRVQLKADSKTVENGPFYSEYLPAETILAAALTLRGAADTESTQRALIRLLHQQLHQIGGDETLGKGLVWYRLIGRETR